MNRAAVFGWGIVAPQSANVAEFASNLERASTWLEPFEGFGKANFLVGNPKFDFADYQPWLAERFPPSRYRQLLDKMDPMALYAIGAFIQSLGQNQGIEQELSALGALAHVYIGSALGSYPTMYDQSIQHYKALRRWNRFWTAPERNTAYRDFLGGNGPPPPVPAPENTTDPDQRLDAIDSWNAFWARQSDGLEQFLTELRAIESIGVEGDVERGKLKAIREKRRGISQLHAKWGAPEPPWNAVSANVLWNMPSTPAAQVSMMGRITGFAFAPAAACSSFNVSLKLALDAIKQGDAKLVVIGACDPAPHELSVGTFYNARVLAADATVSKPLCGLKGTHVSGGAAVWIVGELEYGLSKGFTPLGMEPVSVGVSSDAEHIITPSEDGPRRAIQLALHRAGVEAESLGSWDLHATATPGDHQEVQNLKGILPAEAPLTARKGTFGHGMGAAGGWELTAQYLGYEKGKLYPTPVTEEEIHPSIKALGHHLVMDSAVSFPDKPVGKLSMGVGGLNACVISRPFAKPKDG